MAGLLWLPQAAALQPGSMERSVSIPSQSDSGVPNKYNHCEQWLHLQHKRPEWPKAIDVAQEADRRRTPEPCADVSREMPHVCCLSAALQSRVRVAPVRVSGLPHEHSKLISL